MFENIKIGRYGARFVGLRNAVQDRFFKLVADFSKIVALPELASSVSYTLA